MTESIKIKDKYDVIIIGAGIGGLVCGCYLAKAGLKTLIVEKNNRVGGYCSSFKRNGFTFNSSVHSLTNCRKGGILDTIFCELGLYKLIEIKRSEYPDLIITPDHKIHFYNETEKTIAELQQNFPGERQAIRMFFNSIIESSMVQLFFSLKDKTFEELLNSYFKDYRLKAIFKALLGYIGMPSSVTSAFTAIALYKEFVIEGRYFVKNGVQHLSDALLAIFKDNGGRILFSTKVEKIRIKKDKVEGVVVNKNSFIEARYVVSNCDMKQTFLELVDDTHLSNTFIMQLKRRSVCPSAFLVYLGLDTKLKQIPEKFYSLWYLSSYNIDDLYLKIFNKKIHYALESILCCFSSLSDPSLAPKDKNNISLYLRAAFDDKTEYWDSIKFSLAESLIKKIEDVIPNLSKNIIVKEIATPNTFYKFTLNNNGSTNGWAPTLSQFHEMNERDYFINGLFFVGHWSAFPPVQGGVDTAIYSGKKIAKIILL